MSSIADILGKKSYGEPPEIKLIKDFVRQNFQSTVSVTIQPTQIIITTPSSALAGTLRMHGHKIAELCETDKRLVFRIGS
jgi:hypothetical protein